MANWREQRKPLLVAAAVFLGCFFLALGSARFRGAVVESMWLAREYAREHLLASLLPALLLAGAITAFGRRETVVHYLGAGARRLTAYLVASVSGAVLAVCSCTVLPLFAGICRMGAGIGPATTFLYAGPAVNVLALVLTARILGWRLGLARALGALGFAIVIGLIMQRLYPDPLSPAPVAPPAPGPPPRRRLWQNVFLFLTMLLALLTANWAVSGRLTVGITCCPSGTRVEEYVQGRLLRKTPTEITIQLADGQERTYPREWIGSVEPVADGWSGPAYRYRFVIAAAAAGLLAMLLSLWSDRGELRDWSGATWELAKQILPLLLLGVLAAGFLFGRPQHEGIIPSHWVTMLGGRSPDPLLTALGLPAGGNVIRLLWPVWTNLFAAVIGAFMYFATLTEIPIVEGLRSAGLADGPALALLLAGPALSLPNMLVIRSVIGTRKTVTYVLLVMVMATLSGLLYGVVMPVSRPM